MDVVFILVLPAGLSWLFLAAAPAGSGFAVALAVWAVALGGYSLVARGLADGGGPDNWFAGIPLAGVFLALGAASGPIMAQLWRYRQLRRGCETRYLATLIGTTLIPPVLLFLFIAFVVAP